jgi:prepilin-type N-terminal cleavage/methylation domain-containing protein
MNPGTRRKGHTLIELLAVLATMGIALLMAAPPVERLLDGLAVRSARDALVVELARTRLLARTHGGALLLLDANAATAVIVSESGDTLHPPLLLHAHYRTGLELGSSAQATIRYDALGIGRLANRTLHVVRGGSAARITVSAYGRVRAW